MGYSKTELTNQALDQLGKGRIASLAEVSTAARLANEIIDRVIYTVLARSIWTFSRKIASLAGVTNDWEERWAYKYDLPNDLATLCRVVPSVDIPNHEPQVPHELKGGAIYANETPLKIEYVYNNTDTMTMPQTFLNAVAFLLAREMAMPLTRKRSYWEDANNAYEATLALAIQHDAGQEPTFYGQEGGGYIDDRGGAQDFVEGAAVDGSIYWT